jgi:hypothetical protein
VRSAAVRGGRAGLLEQPVGAMLQPLTQGIEVFGSLEGVAAVHRRRVDFASYPVKVRCGAAEITLQKALRELRTTGVVDTGYRQVIARDSGALQACADVP